MIKEKIYKNGAILLYNKRKKKCVTVNAGFIFGKNRDNHPEPVAHFCEHMFFKETESKDEETLKSCIRETFSQYNGYTNLFYTFIDFCRSKKALPPCFDLASDMLLHTKFSEKLINSEKGVIKQELVRKLSIDGAKFGSACIRTVRKSYSTDTRVLGSEEEIDAITPADLKNFRDETFISQNFVITIKGGISFWKAKRLAQKHFINKLRSNPNYHIDKTLILPFEREGNLTIEHYEKERTLCNVAIKLDSNFDTLKNHQIAKLLCRLSNGTTGKLLGALRDNGLVYAAHLDFDDCPNQNMLIISFECSADNVNKVIDKIGILFKEFRTQLVDEKLIENIKRKTKLEEDERPPRHIYPDHMFFYSYLTQDKAKFTKKYAKKAKKTFNQLSSQDLQEFCQTTLSKPENIYATVLTKESPEKFYSYEEMQKILTEKNLEKSSNLN